MMKKKNENASPSFHLVCNLYDKVYEEGYYVSAKKENE